MIGFVHGFLVLCLNCVLLAHIYYFPYLVNTWPIRIGVGVLILLSAGMSVLIFSAIKSDDKPNCARNFLIYLGLNVSSEEGGGNTYKGCRYRMSHCLFA